MYFMIIFISLLHCKYTLRLKGGLISGVSQGKAVKQLCDEIWLFYTWTLNLTKRYDQKHSLPPTIASCPFVHISLTERCNVLILKDLFLLSKIILFDCCGHLD